MANNINENEISAILRNSNKNQQRTEFYEQSPVRRFEKEQKSAFADTLSETVLSYEYKQAGFTIDLMKRSVLLFNNVLNNTFIYPYSSINEINYSLPDCKSDEAEICIITDDVLNPVWKFSVPSNAHAICEQWIDIFNHHIFCFCSPNDGTKITDNFNS